MLGITGLVFIPTIVIRAAGGAEAYLAWAVFGSVVVGGACTMLQAIRSAAIRPGDGTETGF